MMSNGQVAFWRQQRVPADCIVGDDEAERCLPPPALALAAFLVMMWPSRSSSGRCVVVISHAPFAHCHATSSSLTMQQEKEEQLQQ